MQCTLNGDRDLSVRNWKFSMENGVGDDGEWRVLDGVSVNTAQML